ncbi:hypothetical protein Tco_0581872 [Tanacetum coccineum]
MQDFGRNEASEDAKESVEKHTQFETITIGSRGRKLKIQHTKEVKASTLKQSMLEPTTISKRYTQAASSKVPLLLYYASTQRKSYVPSFLNMHLSTTQDDVRLCCKFDEDADGRNSTFDGKWL